ncbi:hypothetical protein [Rhizobium sp. RCAM05973]|uniref:hypothetical protein n=1 Tax=Rhizobium sp. RCAM05973 TaxID=2994066 RepID=UPI0022EBB6A2|nr:hypothetical protein [Rhizobium sp. RCAM05973]
MIALDVDMWRKIALLRQWRADMAHADKTDLWEGVIDVFWKDTDACSAVRSRGPGYGKLRHAEQRRCFRGK